MHKRALKAVLAAHLKWLRGEAGGARANLADANLADANLARANLARANLAGANLAGAYLTGANLTRANLAGANLTDAYLADAKGLDTAKLPATSIVPAVGAFQAYKKLRNGLIAHLAIPADAKRVNAIGSRKARVSRVKTLAILDGDGILADVKSGRGLYDENTIYRVGRITKPDSFNDDIRVECSHGIHCFITLQEAQEWNR